MDVTHFLSFFRNPFPTVLTSKRINIRWRGLRKRWDQEYWIVIIVTG
jgi:hypothetical protein